MWDVNHERVLAQYTLAVVTADTSLQFCDVDVAVTVFCRADLELGVQETLHP
jgi:hypothetical protein